MCIILDTDLHACIYTFPGLPNTYMGPVGTCKNGVIICGTAKYSTKHGTIIPQKIQNPHFPYFSRKLGKRNTYFAFG